MIEKVTALYFSPCGNAEKIAKIIAERIAYKLDIPVMFDDFTLPEERIAERQYDADELVVFTVPVYAGRIPNKILPAVQNLFKGNRTWIVPIVTFGNRNYDNSLKELCMELDKNGFLPVGVAAFVSEHSFSNKLANGRPDSEDIHIMQDFADAIVDKFSAEIPGRNDFDICPLDINNICLDIDLVPGEWPLEKYYTPLGVDGKPAVFLKAKPKTDVKKCVKCGVCAQKCPMGSVSKDNPECVDGICINCQACVKKCPQGAKYFDNEAFLSHVKMLEENHNCYKENIIFV